jgi:hypothetical protein
VTFRRRWKFALILLCKYPDNGRWKVYGYFTGHLSLRFNENRKFYYRVQKSSGFYPGNSIPRFTYSFSKISFNSIQHSLRKICNTLNVISNSGTMASWSEMFLLPRMRRTTNCCICCPRIIQFPIHTLCLTPFLPTRSQKSETSSQRLQIWIGKPRIILSRADLVVEVYEFLFK